MVTIAVWTGASQVRNFRPLKKCLKQLVGNVRTIVHPTGLVQFAL